MNELIRQMEEGYDPSDVDRAQRVAYKSIGLMYYAQLAIDAEEYGMKLGRDHAGSLHRAITDLGKALGLLPYYDDTDSTDEFLSKLRGDFRESR